MVGKKKSGMAELANKTYVKYCVAAVWWDAHIGPLIYHQYDYYLTWGQYSTGSKMIFTSNTSLDSSSTMNQAGADTYLIDKEVRLKEVVCP